MFGATNPEGYPVAYRMLYRGSKTILTCCGGLEFGGEANLTDPSARIKPFLVDKHPPPN